MWMILMAAQLACQAPEQRLSRPNAIAIAGDRFYVSDFHHQRIVTFHEDGTVLQTFGRRGLGRNQLWQVWGLLSDSETGELFVLNERPTSSTDEDSILEIKTFEEGRETAVVQLTMPDKEVLWSEGISRDQDGNWLLAGVSTDSVHHFSPSGQHKKAMLEPSSGVAFESPSGLHQEDNTLWVIEQFAHRIRRINAEGEQTLVFGTEGSAPGQVRFPRALDLCPGSWMVVADFGNLRVQRYDLDGGYLDGFEPAPANELVPVQLMDVGVSPSCEKLYLIDSKGDRILVTDPVGNLLNEISSW